MLQANFDTAQFDNILGDLEKEFEEAVEDGLDAAAYVYLDKKLARIDETYDRPTDGWERSGAWREGQRIETERGERRIVDTGPAAEPITNYPGGYAEKLGTLNTERRNEAAQNAFEDGEDEAEEAFKRAVDRRLGL